MNDNNYFPDVDSTELSEKDRLCHSLIEAMIFNKTSNDFVLSMLTKLKNYADKNGKDMILDVLFMKYLIKNRTKHYKDEVNNFNAKLIKKQQISQYIIAYVCFNDPKSKFNFKNQIRVQSYKILTKEVITINGISISKVICYYILRCLFYERFEDYENEDDISKNKNNDRFSLDFDIHDENDFMKLLLLRSHDKNKYNRFLIDQKNNDLLYIATKNIDLTGSIVSGGIYSMIKKDIYKGNILKYQNNIVIQHYQNDFIRFIQKAIQCFEGKEKIDSMKLYTAYIKDNEKKIEIIFELIYMKEYDDAIVLLNKFEQITNIKEIITDELHFESIKDLLNCVKAEYACEFIKKFLIEEKLPQQQKLNIIFKNSFPKKRLKISRENILRDSINEFENNNLHHKIIRIRYETEKGIDEGGLSKDWFSNVNDEIIKSNAFIPTPNGSSLTFNNQINDMKIYKFTGQLIASAFINKNNIGIKLASFIWKQMMNEEIGLQDMKEYDEELYESLKWISENDPVPLMMTFVDSDDMELCPGGENIELTNENKKEFIRLMIEKKLIKQNSKQLEQIKLGFSEIIDLNLIYIFKANEIKEMVNGKESIDLEDWKKYTACDYFYEKYCTDFFSIISKWPQEKLQKLLKFATGTSIVPAQGFKYFDSSGGLFHLNFVHVDTNKLPEAHTCFNRIDIPCYETIRKFEDKLLLAIECDTFNIE